MTEAATIILSAGGSTRMGRPKALLPFRGKTLVAHSAELFGRLGPVVVMTSGALGSVIAPLAPDAEIGRNPKPEDGLFSSVRLAVELLPQGVRHVFVMPIDCVLPDDRVPQSLLARAAHGPLDVAVPVFGGTRGHPVLLSDKVAAALPSFEPTRIFSDVLAQFGPVEVPVDEEWILLNINLTSDYNDFLDSERQKGER